MGMAYPYQVQRIASQTSSSKCFLKISKTEKKMVQMWPKNVIQGFSLDPPPPLTHDFLCCKVGRRMKIIILSISEKQTSQPPVPTLLPLSQKNGLAHTSPGFSALTERKILKISELKKNQGSSHKKLGSMGMVYVY